MFGKKLVSDSLVAAAKSVLTSPQVDAGGDSLNVGDQVKISEGPYSGKNGTISQFKSVGQSTVQVAKGPSITISNSALLGESNRD